MIHARAPYEQPLWLGSESDVFSSKVTSKTYYSVPYEHIYIASSSKASTLNTCVCIFATFYKSSLYEKRITKHLTCIKYNSNTYFLPAMSFYIYLDVLMFLFSRQGSFLPRQFCCSDVIYRWLPVTYEIVQRNSWNKKKISNVDNFEGNFMNENFFGLLSFSRAFFLSCVSLFEIINIIIQLCDRNYKTFVLVGRGIYNTKSVLVLSQPSILFRARYLPYSIIINQGLSYTFCCAYSVLVYFPRD